jgi:hypothetical protein
MLLLVKKESIEKGRVSICSLDTAEKMMFIKFSKKSCFEDEVLRYRKIENQYVDD